MKDIVADPSLVAHCGLYCGACGAYLRGTCRGCHGNDKASWCKVRSCCRENEYATCADCGTHPDPKSCSAFHNFISRIIGFFLRSNRSKCIARIREIGVDAFAEEMAGKGRQSLPR